MYGIGGTEVIIIIIVAILIFGGPAVIGFWLGYQAGKKAGDTDAPTPAAQSSETNAEETSSHD